ncbi:MAG: signal peptidase II [Lachnospiraceae bacterium]|nr:signal peptidase II [Lachnospiraceae bacterium]
MESKSLKKRNRTLLAIGVVILLVILDQITKWLAVTHLANTEGIDLISGVLRLEYVENTGTAFSLFEGQFVLFYVITIVVSVAIILCMKRLPYNKKFNMAYFLLAVLLSGALGNFIDRVFRKYVVDFIYFSLIDFPVFNVADIYVTVTVVMIILLFIFYYSDEELTEAFSKKEQ